MAPPHRLLRRGLAALPLCAAVALFGAAVAPSLAFAQTPPDDEDDFEFDLPGSEEPAPSKPAPPPSDDGPLTPEDDDDIDFEDPVAPTDEDKPPARPDILEGTDDDDKDEADLLAPGTDNAQLFRRQEDKVRGMPPDEEVMSWELYLEKYPNSIYRSRIEERIDELVEAQFRMRIDGGSTRAGGGDADDQEILLTQGLGLDNINPRTRAQFGLLFGFPTYLEVDADFEYAIKRPVSVHAGLHGRYTGWSFDLGAKYAFVKSKKLDFVATLMADVGAQFTQRVSETLSDTPGTGNTAQLIFRPQLGFGKVAGPVQILLTAGTEILTRSNSTPAIIGGLHVSGRVAPPVSIYAETEVYVRQLGRDAGPFNFTVLSFGFKFYPITKRTDDPLEIAMAGHMPVASQYLQPYLGAVQAQGVYYLDLPYAGER